MDQDKYPSWMIPLAALFAIILGVSRVSLTPTPSIHGEVTGSAADSKKKAKDNRAGVLSGNSTSQNLLFYQHDALHILHNFFEAGNPSKEDKLGPKLSLGRTGGVTVLDVANESTAANGDKSQQDLLKTVSKGLIKYHVDFMIVGVPDPEASRLSMETDWTLDALQRAIEASVHKFTIDSFDLPWRLSTERAEDGSPAESDERHPGEEPGLMLFKCGKTPIENHLLLVFLVGETPTTGVHKIAFTRAVAQSIALFGLQNKDSRAQLVNEDQVTKFVDGYRLDNGGEPEPRIGKAPRQRLAENLAPATSGKLSIYLKSSSKAPSSKSVLIRVPVLGPHFTASARPYQIAIDEWSRMVSFQFISGTASAVEKESFKRAGASFSATVWPDLPKIQVLLNYLHRRFNFGQDELAILRESNTSYGAAAPFAPPTPSTDDSSQPLDIPFPLHISRLRTSNADSGDSPVPRTGPRARPFLPLTTNDEQEEDLMPPFSRLESVSNLRVLETILATLRRQRVRFILIRATNVEDVIFLAGEIESNCPDTMIFVLTSDDLFLNPDAITGLRGAVMLTTYPLLSDNQEWTRLGTQRLHRIVHFPTQGAEGTYNAMLALLGDSDKDNYDSMLEYRDPFDHHNFCCPPLWMTSVGGDAMWPVEFFPISHTTKNEPKALTEAFNKASAYLFRPKGSFPSKDQREYERRIAQDLRLSRGTERVFWCLWILIAYFAVVFVFPEYWVWRDRTFAYTLIESDQHRKTLFLFFFWAGLWLLSALLVGLSAFPVAALRWSGVPSYFRVEPVIWLTFLAATLLALGISLLPLLRRWRDAAETDFARARQASSSQGFSFAASIVALVVLIGAIVASIVGFHSCSDADAEIVKFFRHANLESGLSIVLPLLYIDLAAMIWAFSNLRRLSFAERMTSSEKGDAQEVGLGFSPRTFPGLSSLEQLVNQTVCTPYLHRLHNSFSASFAGALAVILGCLCYGIVPVRWDPLDATMEGRWFYPVFLVGLLLVGVALTWELLHSFALWQAFRKFLDRVSGEPFLRAFKDDFKDDTFLPRFSISTSYSDLTVVRLALTEVERNRTLAQTVSKPLERCRASLAGLEEASGSPESAKKRITLSQSFSEEIAEKRIALNQSLNELTNAISLDSSRLAANRFLFLRVLDYSQGVGHGLRNLIFWTNSGLFFLLLAISSYQFVNNDALLRFGWMFMLAAIFMTILILVEMNRERVLSIFSGGTPGKMDWNSGFIFHVLALALIPFLGLLGIQFPATFQSTANWITSLFGSVPHQ